MTRGRGEGSFGRTVDGRWWYRVSLGVGADGKRIRKRVYGATKADAMDAARRLRRGGPVVASRDRLGAYLERWLSGLIRAPLTIRNYRSLIDTRIVPGIGHARITDLRPEHIRQWQRDMLASGTSPTMANAARVVLHAAIADAVRDEYIDRNVVSLVRPLKAETRRRTPLDAEQSLRLLEEVRDSRLAPFYTAALGLGLRFGELRGLLWSDIEGEVVNVQRQIPTARPVEMRTLKTGASGRRTLPLFPFVAEALARERTLQLEERLRAGPAWPARGYDLVFRSRVGRPLQTEYVRRDLHARLEAAGLPAVRFHDLRHSTATLLLTLGVDMRTVQIVMGHSSMRTTEIYAHVMPELTRDAMGRLDTLFRRDAR